MPLAIYRYSSLADIHLHLQKQKQCKATIHRRMLQTKNDVTCFLCIVQAVLVLHGCMSCWLVFKRNSFWLQAFARFMRGALQPRVKLHWPLVMIRPHCVHAVPRYGLLLQMWDGRCVRMLRVCVCLSVGHNCEPRCKNGRTDWDAIWGMDGLLGPKEPCIGQWPGCSNLWEGTLFGNGVILWACPWLIFSTLCTRGSSHVASGYQYCTSLLLLSLKIYQL